MSRLLQRGVDDEEEHDVLPVAERARDRDAWVFGPQCRREGPDLKCDQAESNERLVVQQERHVAPAHEHHDPRQRQNRSGSLDARYLDAASRTGTGKMLKERRHREERDSRG